MLEAGTAQSAVLTAVLFLFCENIFVLSIAERRWTPELRREARTPLVELKKPALPRISLERAMIQGYARNTPDYL